MFWCQRRCHVLMSTPMSCFDVDPYVMFWCRCRCHALMSMPMSCFDVDADVMFWCRRRCYTLILEQMWERGAFLLWLCFARLDLLRCRNVRMGGGVYCATMFCMVWSKPWDFLHLNVKLLSRWNTNQHDCDYYVWTWKRSINVLFISRVLFLLSGKMSILPDTLIRAQSVQKWFKD